MIHFFSNRFSSGSPASGWGFLLAGINFVLLAVLIFAFPDLLAYLVASFLLFNGLLMVGLGLWARRLRKSSSLHRQGDWMEG